MADDDKAAGLRIIDMGLEAGNPVAPEEFIRQVRLLDCVREVIEHAHGPAYWSMIYRSAEILRRQKAERLSRGEPSWET